MVYALKLMRIMTKEPSGNLKAKKLDGVTLKAANNCFPIVGIGASAGGLEALEIFLKNVPSRCGIAFVIVQHLDPTHKGIMVELLQRVTDIPVVQVRDRLKIEPDHVYVIPPNKDMSLLHGVLHLLAPVEPRGLRLPIDFFFRSLADDLQQQSIGVILSGMGSDGSHGLRAIKENGGGVFVQAPSSAKFDGMPRSAIEAGRVDVIAPVEELPAKIITYLRHFPLLPLQQDPPLEERALSGLEKVVILLRTHTGQDFSLYKKSTIYRRIERRMGIHQIEKIADYVRFLQENPHETDLLFKELLIGVTSFFRDPAVWEILKLKAIPALLAAHPAGGVLRAWVVGCSSGEEAYSLAIIFKEAVASVKPLGNFKLQIFATDLDKDAIDKARTGCFPLNISAEVSTERLQRFFERDNNSYRILREIRETVVFAPQNVIMDPPFTKLDILVCRNLLIYMEPELQKKLFPLFHYTLNPGGILFLGSAESLGSFTSLFKPIDGKTRLFSKLHHGVRPEPLALPFSFAHSLPVPQDVAIDQPKSKSSAINLQSMTDQFLLEHYTPAAVLTNDKGDIIYISGHTGKYLEPAAGKANWNIFAMAREGLRYELNLMFGNALRQQGVATKRGLSVSSNGETQAVNLTIRLLEKPDALHGLVLIVFSDVERVVGGTLRDPALSVDRGGARQKLLEQELSQARDEILSIREEMQTSQEELKSTNEEMQSANEELQSTNEELTTSKEEMQSMNEELQTVNHELQSKVSDLSQANNDMKNLLNSTDIATLFLDDALNIRRFTTRTAAIIKLIASDVGRPITDIVTELHYPALADDAREVLHTLVYSEKQVSASNGRWFSVKIMPYRTQENRIVGLVITFSDISVAKKLEESLRESEERLRAAIESSGIIVAAVDKEFRYIWFYDPRHMFHASTSIGMRDEELPGMQNAAELMEIRQKVIATGESVHRDLMLKQADGCRSFYTLIARPLRDAGGNVIGVITVAADNTARKEAEVAQKESEDRFRLLFDAIPEGALLLDAKGRIIMVNPEAERILGFSREEMQGKTSSELRWKIVREDGSDFPFEEHPAFVALRTAQPVRGVIIGVFQPGHNHCRWIRINAQPWFQAGMEAPFQVYMTFVDIKSFRSCPEIKQEENPS
ncbi:MCP methyltransferase/methylesterase, CheR/CheB with PAS/PAC sensor [Pelodictyon phaeoclathratiforme BU-1]|uniref:protein-glutamate O-methyltransferase n=2 Tax=Pelodictyon phaeoclathratiforme TaxID=34090 RepID=B4SBP1_PELPB|nr:MCP methyltransferase/methylesterase, CheR/CheB with PAS/PAC sensor [Pelodictyon phaeoclathratiforme BU-1]